MRYNTELKHSLLLVSILVVASIGLLPGSTAAQSTDLVLNQTELLEEAQEDPEVYEHAITDDVRIVDYSYNSDGKLTMVVESDKRVSGTITDASRPIVGTIDIPQKDVSLVEGRTEVTFQVVNEDNAAVTFKTDGRLTGVGEQGATVFTGPATWSYVRVAAGSGMIGSLLPLGYVAVKKRHERDEEVDRVL